jgi:hypothetical protein
MAGVKYHYALDEHNSLVSIKQAYLERNEPHIYRCVGCGAMMIARLGEVRNWHFAHRGNEEHCANETYLHQLAKRLIREKFENDSTFMVGYYRDVKCSDIGSCPFAMPDECHVPKLETFDLKEFYDTCKEEQSVGNYIADLLLTNSSKPDRDPVLIEIQVSHKSTPQKLNSGLRIIEIRIRTEDDIDALLKDTIVENPEAKFGQVRDDKTIGFAKFIGFKKKASVPEPLEQRSIQRFYLFRSGKAFVTNLDEFKSCRKVFTKDNDKAIFEASIDSFYLDSPTPYEFGLVMARENGIEIKTCQFCKYHRSGFEVGFGLSPIFCCLYKKYGTPENPNPQYAKDCSYYQEDSKLLDEIRNSMPPIVVAKTSNTGKL